MRKTVVFDVMIVMAALLGVASLAQGGGHTAPNGLREFNVTCPANELLPKLDLAYHRCNNGRQESCESFVTFFRQALPEYDCQRDFDKDYVVSVLWLADAADEDYTRLLSRLKLPHAQQLFASPEFRDVLGGALAEEYGPLSRKAEKGLKFGMSDGSCLIRYDNERGKGDHRHVADNEESYSFSTVLKLIEDFETDIERM